MRKNILKANLKIFGETDKISQYSLDVQSQCSPDLAPGMMDRWNERSKRIPEKQDRRTFGTKTKMNIRKYKLKEGSALEE